MAKDPYYKKAWSVKGKKVEVADRYADTLLEFKRMQSYRNQIVDLGQKKQHVTRKQIDPTNPPDNITSYDYIDANEAEILNSLGIKNHKRSNKNPKPIAQSPQIKTRSKINRMVLRNKKKA